jgi:hypothetical protein
VKKNLCLPTKTQGFGEIMDIGKCFSPTAENFKLSNNNITNYSSLLKVTRQPIGKRVVSGGNISNIRDYPFI